MSGFSFKPGGRSRFYNPMKDDIFNEEEERERTLEELRTDPRYIKIVTVFDKYRTKVDRAKNESMKLVRNVDQALKQMNRIIPDIDNLPSFYRSVGEIRDMVADLLEDVETVKLRLNEVRNGLKANFLKNRDFDKVTASNRVRYNFESMLASVEVSDSVKKVLTKKGN